MNERFLFRGKRTDNGEWVNGGYCEIPPPPQAIGERLPSKICIFTKHPNTITDWGMPRQMCLIDVKPATIGQCSGLRDKNGKLIFEGDILQEDRNSTSFVFRVDWVNGNGAFLLCVREGKILKGCCGMEMSCDMRIIGNLHDNPELLEPKEV